MIWIMLHEKMTPEHLGFIPSFLDEADPRPVKEQIAAKYVGGWHPFSGFRLLSGGSLKYPGDPPTKCLAMTKLRDEVVYFYEHDWLRVEQRDGTWEVSRVD